MFHLTDGWYFERTPEGNVYIEKRASAQDDAPVIASITVDPDGWASIVAHVSVYGDHQPYWEQARNFHNGIEEKAI